MDSRFAKSLGGGCMGALLVVVGCASLVEEPEPMPRPADAAARRHLWDVENPTGPGSPVTSQPADNEDPLAKPYRLNTENIIHILYEEAPKIASSRQSMIAARYGLEEFKADLSRFEPFVNSDGTLFQYPERRDSDGITGESVAGLEKETFDGAIYRAEGGMSGSRVDFGDVEEDEDSVEEGSGGLVRGRVEVPFIGSRKRQSRVINAAFQESNARAAMMEYLSDYTRTVKQTLQYYQRTLYNLRFIRMYEKKLKLLQELMEDPRTRADDIQRIQSVVLSTKVTIEEYRVNYESFLLVVLEYLGIAPGEEFVLQETSAEAAASRYLELACNGEGRKKMLENAMENTPKFQVLRDAIADAQLKRSYAIKGIFDITAYLEGTRYAFGSASYDDRVGGWDTNVGASVRLNDQRVLDASRKKAEAEIRQYRSDIEAQRLYIQREIDTESAELCSRYESRPRIKANIKNSWSVFHTRRKKYLDDPASIVSIDDLLGSLNEAITAEKQLNQNIYQAAMSERSLMAVTGYVYELVGLELSGKDNKSQLMSDPTGAP